MLLNILCKILLKLTLLQYYSLVILAHPRRGRFARFSACAVVSVLAMPTHF